MLHHGIGVGVTTARKESTIDLVIYLELHALRAESLGVDVSAKLDCWQIGCWHSQFSQPGLWNKFDTIREFVVKIGQAQPRTTVPQLLVDTTLVGAGVLRTYLSDMKLSD